MNQCPSIHLMACRIRSNVEERLVLEWRCSSSSRLIVSADRRFPDNNSRTDRQGRQARRSSHDVITVPVGSTSSTEKCNNGDINRNHSATAGIGGRPPLLLWLFSSCRGESPREEADRRRRIVICQIPYTHAVHLRSNSSRSGTPDDRVLHREANEARCRFRRALTQPFSFPPHGGVVERTVF